MRNIKNSFVYKRLRTYYHVVFTRRKDLSKINQDFKSIYYSSEIRLIGCHEKMVIVMLDGKRHHGGLSDRLMGILTTFMVCKELGVQFRIYFVHPFQLENYLEPNLYDWKISENEISYNAEEAEPLLVSATSVKFDRTFVYKYIKKRIALSQGKQIHVYTNASYSLHHNYSNLFHELFKPTKLVENDILYYKRMWGRGYVNITLRFQNLLNDFNEGSFPSLDEKERNLVMEKCRRKILSMHEKQPETLILVTSDSKTFLDVIKPYDFVRTIEGELVHMDFTEQDSLNLHKKAFVDSLFD